MKAEYDTRPTGVGHTWAKFSLAPLRILYKDGNKAESWRGFEMLAQVKKFALLKMLLTDASKILTIVLEQLEMVGKVLKCGEEGTPIAGLLKAKNAPISTFEQGVVDMQHYLEQFGEGGKWSQAEIKEFLEVEKITIDNLDLLTLGTATLRTLLHDARHIVHVCYELTRELDYMECRQMAVYEDVVKHHPSFGENKAGDVTISKNKTKRNSTRSDTVSIAASQAQNNKRKKRSAFDIEERNLDQKDVETQFDRSIYQDIIKELPVFINNLSIALTLQEAEAVFSESSHAMLSTQVHV
ncbi:Small conductance calcium-activated potassium channel-like protein 3 [Folsomia candida]|uniref:Small conductance calcium-activated potassium channel-like protein 3 n=1 Tax=Folsomia candida TaxID=158441 RepID=A0A226ED50_FOLCA|nr:Small conductance calcium-activated potassium channel-like protein 3 [Folsomia candida]